MTRHNTAGERISKRVGTRVGEGFPNALRAGFLLALLVLASTPVAASPVADREECPRRSGLLVVGDHEALDLDRQSFNESRVWLLSTPKGDALIVGSYGDTSYYVIIGLEYNAPMVAEEGGCAW